MSCTEYPGVAGGASASAHSRATILYPRHGQVVRAPSLASDSRPTASRRSRTSPRRAPRRRPRRTAAVSGSPSEEGSPRGRVVRVGRVEECDEAFNEETSFFPETVRPEKAPDNDRPTEARRPDARTGSFDRRMFCATFVKFVVPRKEMVCRFRALSVAMNRRCFTDFMSSTTTSSAVSAKNASISDAGALFSDAMRANRSSSSNVDTTGNGGGAPPPSPAACSCAPELRGGGRDDVRYGFKALSQGFERRAAFDLTVGGVGVAAAPARRRRRTNRHPPRFTGRETSSRFRLEAKHSPSTDDPTRPPARDPARRRRQPSPPPGFPSRRWRAA